MTDRLDYGEFYTIDYLKNSGNVNAKSLDFIFNFTLDLTKTAQDSGVTNNGGDDTSPVVKVVYKPLSNSGDALLTTGYRDNYINKGQSYANEAIRIQTGANTEFFVLDASLCDCDKVYKLPISVAPSAGYVTVALYEATNYVGVTALTFINRNRTISTLPKTTLKLCSVAGTIKGTELFNTLFGTEATRQNAGGGSGASSNALILDTTKKYLFEVYNSEACTIGYNMEIVEV